MRTLAKTALIEYPRRTQDIYGASVIAWSTLAIVRASITATLGSESDTQGTQISSTRYEVLIRYITGVTATMRATIDGRTLEIKSVLEVGRRSMIRLICEEVI